jgi:carbamoyl-phosphate synthase large subunit
MPRKAAVKKVLVIGSGPIVIGQAAEFDYAGTQACRALREEGIEIVLVNSNPATIMTDQALADKVYIEPLNAETLEKIILKEKPDSILPTLGGQTGLNLAVELSESGFLEKNNIVLLGTSVDAIRNSEDRQLFKETMQKIGEPCIPSQVVSTLHEAQVFAQEIGFPVVVRPAYTLGGSGGGIAYTPEQLDEIGSYGLRLSRVKQILIEKCVSGWKEIEFEVMRDGSGHAVSVCDMENFDPVGIHTGDSIVVAPSQTLSRDVFHTLKAAALKIIQSLGIEGGCNIQFALHPLTHEYAVIEVNPRVSRSSALASKAAGYPIARIATKIAVGYTLSEIPNTITGETFHGYEPQLGYIVLKIPKWPFDKFLSADRNLGTQMKATGEVMAVSDSFESALMKAIRSLELNLYSLDHDSYKLYTDEYLLDHMVKADDERIFAIAEALRRGVGIDRIHRLTAIDEFFLKKLANLVAIEKRLKTVKLDEMNTDLLFAAKAAGYPDRAIAKFVGAKDEDVRELIRKSGIRVHFKEVQTSIASSKESSPYYYSSISCGSQSGMHSYKQEGIKKVLVLGSGPIRIGQGIEFDYCTVHAVWALKDAGYTAIIVNNNPETVSTDFDTADKLYFEPLTNEDIRNIVEAEKPEGALVQFGGQTGIKLAKNLKEMGVEILGTSVEAIDEAEDRAKFDRLLEKLQLKRPVGKTVFSAPEAVQAAKEIGYPVLVRPSYVLGGQGMEIAYSDEDMTLFMKNIRQEDQEHPILIDKYLMGKEIEIDAVCDGEEILVPGIMEHLERAGIHSGDSISVFPPQNLGREIQEEIVKCAHILAKNLQVKGLMNIQFVYFEGVLYIIEVNPRSSRTVPIMSKVTGVPMVRVATEIALGKKLTDYAYGTGLMAQVQFAAVKVPVFSFEKLRDVDTSLGPEMKSTGEVLGVASSFNSAFIKGLTAAGIHLPKRNSGVLFTVRNTDKEEAAVLAEGFLSLGFKLWATERTSDFMQEKGIPVNSVKKIGDPSPNIIDLIESGQVSLIINTPTRGKKPERDGFKIRRKALEMAIPCLTSLDTAKAILETVTLNSNEEGVDVTSLDCYSIL